MRHVSRTHKVALDWLFDRIILDPKIQNWYIDTKHQFADILYKDNFTRDEWNNLLQLFNISHFISFCCAQNLSLNCSSNKLAKRHIEQKEETGLWRNQSPWRWTWLQLSRQVSHPWTIRLRQKARGYSKHLQENLTRGQEEIQNPTQRRVLEEGWNMHILADYWLK